MIYQLLKPLASIATRQFFREIHVTGEDPVEDGPLLIVANHPNVMLDGLLIIHLFRRPVWILAKATLFKGPHVNWFLRTLHLVPVHRLQDMGDEADLASRNQEAFHAACELLNEGGSILVFPEGQSIATRQIQDLKTGVARIAFQMEAGNNFSSNLKVQPIGITYSDFQRFNSSVTVTVGRPLCIREYSERYCLDPAATVRELTDQISDDLQALSVVVQRPEDIPLVEKIAKVYRSVRLGASDDRERIEKVSNEVARLAPQFPDQAEALGKRVTLYLQLCSSLKLDGSEGLQVEEGHLFVLLVTPFVILGIIASYIPYRVVAYLGRWASHGVKSQVASWGLSMGFVLFPLWYALLALFAGWYLEDLLSALLVFVILVSSGLYVNWHLNTVMLYFLRTFWPGRRTPLDVIRSMRRDLISELERFRKLTENGDQ